MEFIPLKCETKDELSDDDVSIVKAEPGLEELEKLLPPIAADALKSQGVFTPADLKVLSKELVESTLRDGGVPLGEIAQVNRVWARMHASASSQERRGRSRSPRKGKSGKGGKGGKGSKSGKSKGKGKGRREKQDSPLWTAARSGDTARIGELLDDGRDVDERHEGWTPMMGAAELGFSHAVRLLLTRKADIDAVNGKGRSALSFSAAPSRDGEADAARESQLGVMDMLIAHGADVNLVDKRGETALATAKRQLAEHASRSKAVDFLMQACRR